MKDFVAIDFETANRERTSICSVGLVRVENGDIREKIYRLIRPYPDYYSSWNTRIHGLTYRDTSRSDVSGYGARGSLSGGLGRHLSGVGGFAVGSP